MAQKFTHGGGYHATSKSGQAGGSWYGGQAGGSYYGSMGHR